MHSLEKCKWGEARDEETVWDQECEIKRLEREKGGKLKKKKKKRKKEKGNSGKHTENGSASHLGRARGLMNYLIAYPPNPSAPSPCCVPPAPNRVM